MNLFKKLIYVIKQIIIDIYTTIIKFAKWLIGFIGPVEDAVYGAVNEKELYRVISGATAVTGSVWELSKYLYNHAGEWISNDSTLLFIKAFIELTKKNWFFGIMFISLVSLEYLRRKHQGESSQ